MSLSAPMLMPSAFKKSDIHQGDNSRWRSRKSVMAIINATPDSFSDDGIYANTTDEQAITRVLIQAIQAGADILDIGAESTRPGSMPVPADEQIRRLQPIFSALSQMTTPLPEISVDTSAVEVADFALQAGARIINDVRGGQDADLRRAVAQYRAEIVIMHNSSVQDQWQDWGDLGKSYAADDRDDIVAQVAGVLQQQAEQARQSGILYQNIILDPGIGFGKSVADNIALIKGCERLRSLAMPILVGASRKSFIGKILNSSTADRLEGSLVAHLQAWQAGADIVRVHDVAAHTRALRLLQAFQYDNTGRNVILDAGKKA